MSDARLIRLAAALGAVVPERPVCPGHAAPAEFFVPWVRERPAVSLVCGPRGGGKSYLRALATHLVSVAWPGHGTRVLGGSMSQSEQVYEALGRCRDKNPSAFASYTRTRALYRTGSSVKILAASPTSVRGPHVPTLCLDEVDEIDPEIREAALGMCMRMDGCHASVGMTSTWHNVGGAMDALMERSRAGEFPSHTFCAFEVLERCPEARSGRRTGGEDLYEGCPGCPLKPYCHADVSPCPITGRAEPKAKRSAGHYAVDSLVQKVRAVSRRVFEADYLCGGPKADGLWFPGFGRDSHVGEDAEYEPSLPVTLAVDCGTSRYTGAVLMQVRERADGTHLATAFDEYLGVDVVSEANARELHRLAESRCRGRLERVRLDPASKQRTSIGPVVYGEYQKLFGRLVAPWPLMRVRESLDLLDSFVRPAGGGVALRVHPRCKHLIDAFGSYRRAKRGSVYTDTPEEVHPHEDLIDALRGGLGDHFPAGRRPKADPAAQVSARRLF